MAKQVLTRVFVQDDFGSEGPDYALISFPNGTDEVQRRVAATKAMAKEFGATEEDPRLGDLYNTEWYLYGAGVEITWLREAALYDPDSDEDPEWLAQLEHDCYVILEDYEPNLGDVVHGDYENEFYSVDLEKLLANVDGELEIRGNIKNCGTQFVTAEFTVDMFGELLHPE